MERTPDRSQEPGHRTVLPLVPGAGLDSSLPSVAACPQGPVPPAPARGDLQVFEVCDPPAGLTNYYLAESSAEALRMDTGDPEADLKTTDVEIRPIPKEWKLYTAGQGGEYQTLSAGEWAKAGTRGFFSESVYIAERPAPAPEPQTVRLIPREPGQVEMMEWLIGQLNRALPMGQGHIGVCEQYQGRGVIALNKWGLTGPESLLDQAVAELQGHGFTEDWRMKASDGEVRVVVALADRFRGEMHGKDVSVFRNEEGFAVYINDTYEALRSSMAKGLDFALRATSGAIRRRPITQI